jgi:cytochrome c551/c552/uncharacterized membrane protein YhaH (DUF805 family)
MRISNYIHNRFEMRNNISAQLIRWKIKYLTILLIGGLFFFPSNSFSQADGKKLFKQACASCHTITNDKLVGPGLKDIAKKRKEDWLLKWIKGSSALIKSGDADAKAIFDKYNGMVMPDQNFSDEEIKAMLAYVDAGDAPTAIALNDSTSLKTNAPANQENSIGLSSPIIWIISAFIIALFLFYLWLSSLNKKLKASGYKGIAIMNTSISEFLINQINQNKKIVAIIFIVIALVGVKSCWDGLIGIGVSQGYEPTQPIQYSHKIHAGQNGIDCQYCHSGAYKSKTAGVPSANVCMNCHKYIQTGATTGKEEIAKIYKALDYNPETQEYGNSPKPIEWIRVHNLPDLTYFNHAQHVVAGDVQCQTCHGQIQEMDVVKQYAPLTMKWCIECHKSTEVKMETNPYYEQIHKKLKEKYKGQKITVDKIGGLDCAKCHY